MVRNTLLNDKSNLSYAESDLSKFDLLFLISLHFHFLLLRRCSYDFLTRFSVNVSCNAGLFDTALPEDTMAVLQDHIVTMNNWSRTSKLKFNIVTKAHCYLTELIVVRA